MEFEQLQAQWRLLDQKLEQTLAMHSVLLQRAGLQAARRHLNHLAFWPVVDLALGVFVIFLSGSCLGDHWTAPTLAVPAAGLMIAAIAFLIGNIRQLTLVGMIAWDGPIGGIQAAMSRLRRARIQQLKWVILLSPLVWFAALCVGVNALFGANVIASADRAWVIGNIVFGVLFVPGGILLARTASSMWSDRSGWKRVMDSVSGRGLVEAQRELEEWTELAREPSIEKH